MKKKRGTYVFTMHHGDVGNCPTDRGAGYSNKNIPHSERAEIQSQKFQQGSRYIFKADVSLAKGYATSAKTTIFQVHQWDTKHCKCGPYVMIFFDKSGHLSARILKSHHQHHIRRLGGFTRQDFEGRWVELAVDINTDKARAGVTIYVDGKPVHSEPVLVQDGGTVFFKTGLYRHGRISPMLTSDRLFVTDIGYARVN